LLRNSERSGERGITASGFSVGKNSEEFQICRFFRKPVVFAPLSFLKDDYFISGLCKNLGRTCEPFNQRVM